MGSSVPSEVACLLQLLQGNKPVFKEDSTTSSIIIFTWNARGASYRPLPEATQCLEPVLQPYRSLCIGANEIMPVKPRWLLKIQILQSHSTSDQLTEN